MQNGLIEAVGADVTGAGRRGRDRRRRHDGLSRPHRHGQSRPAPTSRSTYRSRSRVRATLEEAERAKRTLILRPQRRGGRARAARTRRNCRASPRAASRQRPRDAAPGSSSRARARWSTSPPPEFEPSSAPSPSRARGLEIVRSPVALHVALTRVRPGDGYPAALLGSDRVRAPELHRRAVPAARAPALREGYQTGLARPSFDPALDAMQPALARTPAGRVRGRTRSARSSAPSTWRRSST